MAERERAAKQVGTAGIAVACGQRQSPGTGFGQHAASTAERARPDDVLAIGIDLILLAARGAEPGGVVHCVRRAILQDAAAEMYRAGAAKRAGMAERERTPDQVGAAGIGVGIGNGETRRA